MKSPASCSATRVLCILCTIAVAAAFSDRRPHLVQDTLHGQHPQPQLDKRHGLSPVRRTQLQASALASTSSSLQEQNALPTYVKLPSRFIKRTKQIATTGPVSQSYEMIERLFLAGADVFRINFSHSTDEEKVNRVKYIRQVEAKHGHPISILADLQGPKLRIGQFRREDEKIMLKAGQHFTLDLKDEPGDELRVRFPHPEILEVLRESDALLLDDGKIRLRVVTRESTSVTAVVETDGLISQRKGVNIPTVSLPISPLTPKDRRDLEFALSLGVDWVALSFVQKPEDMTELRSLVGDRVKIMAKIEKPAAIQSLDEIVRLSDGVMVARGDLGVEMRPWEVPAMQKRIVQTCHRMGKPVVVATQMLESMITSPVPTRAEANDVANSIYDTADAVMLSAESASGMFPTEAVEMQHRVIHAVESDTAFKQLLHRKEPARDNTLTEAMLLSARQAAHDVGAKAIAILTNSGTSALQLAKLRPSVPILAVTPTLEAARGLAMIWGVYPIVVEGALSTSFEELLPCVCQAAKDKGLVTSPDDLLVVTAGLPLGVSGAANTVRVVPAGGPTSWEAKHPAGLPPQSRGLG